MADVILENKRLNPKLTRRVSVTTITPRSEDSQKTISSTFSDKRSVGFPEIVPRSIPVSANEHIEEEEEEEGQVLSKEEEIASMRRKSRLNSVIPPPPEDDDIIEVKKKESPYSALNAPMLITWLNKHYDELNTALSGLKFIFKHAQTGQGCVLLLKYDVLRVVLKVQSYEGYRDNKELQCLCVSIFRQLLECNYTREPLILTTDVLKTTFSIGHRFMSNKDIVTASVHCILQCARSELNRVEIMNSNIIGYCSNFCKLYSKDPPILRCVLKLFYWVANNDKRMDEICQKSALETTLQCMKRHMCNADVLKPGIRFLTRACSLTWCLELILKKNAVALIITALRALYNEAELQLEGLKMLQTLSKTEDGYRQISETKGGWQSICQGTTLGNALLHDLKGDFHNHGWCIGDTPVLTTLDRLKRSTMEMSQNSLRGATQSLWTCRSLMEFMGLSMNGRTLAVTVERNDVYFELIASLDLLPLSVKEERGAWFQRLGIFEKENSILIDDMVAAVISMKRKDNNENKKDLGEDGLETLKPVFVNGILVNMQTLAEKDVNAEEALEDAGVM